VIGETGKLTGIVSQGDVIRRAEPGARWARWLLPSAGSMRSSSRQE
jgi:hypothetical protein